MHTAHHGPDNHTITKACHTSIKYSYVVFTTETVLDENILWHNSVCFYFFTNFDTPLTKRKSLLHSQKNYLGVLFTTETAVYENSLWDNSFCT